MIITYLCLSCLQSCWWEVGPRVGPEGLGRVYSTFPVPSAGILNPCSREAYTIPTGFIYHSKLWERWPERGMLWGLSPCSLLPDGERKQHLDFLSPTGGLGGAGAFLSSSVSSRREVGDGLGIGGRWEPSPSPQSSALGHGGVQLCLAHLCCS